MPKHEMPKCIYIYIYKHTHTITHTHTRVIYGETTAAK